MARAGRRRSVVWACFADNSINGKRRVLCRFCQRDVVANPARMVRHILTYCPHADEPHKQICRDYQALTLPARRLAEHTASNSIATTAVPTATSTTVAASSSLVETSIVAHTSQERSVHTTQTSTDPVPAATSPLALPVATATPSASPSFVLSTSRSEDTAVVRNLSGFDFQHGQPHQVRPLLATANVSEMDPETLLHTQELLVLGVLRSGASWGLLTDPHFCRALGNLQPQFTVPSTRDITHQLLPRLRTSAEKRNSDVLGTASILTVQVTACTTSTGAEILELYATDQDHRQVFCDTLPRIEASTETQARIALRQIPRKDSCMLHLCIDAFSPVASTPGTTSDMPAQSSAQHSIAPVLVGQCMIQRSLLLLSMLMDDVPTIRRTIKTCSALLLLLADRPDLVDALRDENGSRIGQIDLVSAESIWSIVTAVHQVYGWRESLKRLFASEAMDRFHLSSMLRASSFWTDMELTRSVLRPIGFLAAVSDIRQICSSLLMCCWLLVTALILQSHVLSPRTKDTFSSHMMGHISENWEPHVLACLVLDPQTSGVGLSPLGRRKMRTVIGELACRVDPSIKQQHVVESVVKFLTRQSPFNDDTSWQMVATMPRLFWLEYASDVQALAGIALAVLGFRPFIRSLEEAWRHVTMNPGAPHTVHNASLPVAPWDESYRDISNHSELVYRQSEDYRKVALNIYSSVLGGASWAATSVSEGAVEVVAPTSSMTAASIKETTEGPSDRESLGSIKDRTHSPCHQFFARLDSIKSKFTRIPDGDYINSTRPDSPAEATVVGLQDFDASWLDLASPVVVQQLEAILHRAAFGGDPLHAHNHEESSSYLDVEVPTMSPGESPLHLLDHPSL